jgi:hypothetical protein
LNTSNPSWELLAGAYELRPGRLRSVAGQRPVLDAGRLGALLQGRRGPQVGQALTSVFSLCAHAHRRTADLALAQASGGPQRTGRADSRVLLLETARDHLRTIALDWPQRLNRPGETAPPELAWLRGCPVPLAGPPAAGDAEAARALADFGRWLGRDVLLEPPAAWLARHPSTALAAWCDRHSARLPPARCLAAWHAKGDGLRPAARCLDILDDDPQRQGNQLRLLAGDLTADALFAQQPTWAGACAENGPWARLRHRAGSTPLTRSIWTRLTSRWLELVEIGAFGCQPQPGGAPLLASGAMALAPGEALAWCEMARGLLFHWVRVDAQGAVLDYRVLAPTEWNFHPQGTLALAVAQLEPGDVAAATTLAAAFDPCVSCNVLAAP